MKLKLLLVFALASFIKVQTLKAQVQIDGFFNEKGAANIALSYTHASYDKLYIGQTEMNTVPVHNEINQTIYNLYANYGITNKITIVASLPYIVSDNSSGANDPINDTKEQSGIQDFGFMVKWAPYKQTMDNGTVTYIVALGGTYASNYEPTGILSLGNGAPSIDGKLGFQYNNNSGFFGNIIVGYSLRGNADNNLDLGDGTSFDVPNSYNTQIKLGYACKVIYADVWFDSQKTNKGIDIGTSAFFGNFPENTVNYSRVGLNLFSPITSNIGISAGAGTVIDGRNVGKTTYFSGALILSLGK